MMQSVLFLDIVEQSLQAAQVLALGKDGAERAWLASKDLLGFAVCAFHGKCLPVN